MKIIIQILIILITSQLLCAYNYSTHKKGLIHKWESRRKKLVQQYELKKSYLNNICNSSWSSNTKNVILLDRNFINNKIKVKKNKRCSIRNRFNKYKKLIAFYSKKHHISPGLISSMTLTESAFNPNALSKSQAVGIMQILPSTANEVFFDLYKKKEYINNRKLFNVHLNLDLGCGYVHKLYKMFESLPTKQRKLAVIASYNCGPGRTKKIISKYKLSNSEYSRFYKVLKTQLPKETKLYIDNVLNNIQFYTDVFYKEDLS